MAHRRTVDRMATSTIEVVWATEVGQRHGENQDSCVAIPEDGLFVVSDGMGGEHAGDVASSMVVEWAPRLVARHLKHAEGYNARALELALRGAVVELNHRVREESSQLEGAARMGATVVLALVRGESLHVAHMGDSRAYCWASGGLTRLTDDHSVAAVLARRGALTPEQAACHPMRTRLSRYVGMGGNAYPDLRTVRFGPRQRLLLCTDGLTEAVPDDAIARLLGAETDLEAVCNSLVDEAEAGESPDNVTAMVVERKPV